ncbi:serine/threonine-protein kinase [Tessaracoccus sp. G1721]
MTQDWLVSTRSDRGGGFRPDPERSSPSLPPQVAAEFAALEPLYPQLAVGGSTEAEGIAVATYRYSPRLRSWVVVVQGSSGQYGPAGAIQLAVLAGGGTLLDCLTGSLPVVRRDGWLAPGETARPRVTLRAPGAEVERALAGLLSLDASNRVLLLPGGQGEVDQLLGWLCRILPEGVAQGYTWSTSLAASRIEAGETVISGGWPEALRARHADIFRAFSARAQEARSGGPRLPEGLAWALGEAAERRYPGRRSQAADLAEWLEELEGRRPLTAGEALQLVRGRVEGPQARRWADGDLSRRLLTADLEQLERLLTHPSEVVSRGAVDCLDAPGVWGHLVRLERRRARKGLAPMLPPGLLETDALVLLAEDVTSGWDVSLLKEARPWLDGLGLTAETAPGLVVLTAAEQAQALQRDPRRIRRLVSSGQAAELGSGYLAELVRHEPRLLAPLAVEMARSGSGLEDDVASLLATVPSAVAGGRAATSFLQECSRHLPTGLMPRDARALRWRIADAAATVAAAHRAGRAVVDDATDAAILRFAVEGGQDPGADPADRLGRGLRWLVLGVVALMAVALIVVLILTLAL